MSTALPWTGRASCICTVPRPQGRRIQNGISYNPCEKCGLSVPLTDEQVEGRRIQAERNANVRRS